MLLSDLWLYNEWRRDINEEYWILWFVIVLYDREFETVHGLPRSSWIKIIGIMIVWDPNDWRISATTSENWEEYLFSGETSFFLPNYVSTRDITRSNPIITNGSSKASIGVQDGISGLQLDLCIILFWCPKWSILLLKQIQDDQEIKALTVNSLYCTWSSSQH